MNWPEWWEWELEILVHVEDRMVDRGFSEVELRSMLEDAANLEPDHVPGRWLAYTRHGDRSWVVVVEPDFGAQILLIITAFERERAP